MEQTEVNRPTAVNAKNENFDDIDSKDMELLSDLLSEDSHSLEAWMDSFLEPTGGAPAVTVGDGGVHVMTLATTAAAFGLMCSPKRFNVALTRAKALVVGAGQAAQAAAKSAPKFVVGPGVMGAVYAMCIVGYAAIAEQ